MATRHHWYEALRELAVRNATVQVMPLVRADGAGPADGDLAGDQEPPMYTTRLLEVGEDESLMLELPPVPDQARALRQAAALDVLAVSGGQRWIGRCPVREPVRYRLNERTGVLALRLAPAEQIHSGQRRDFFRVDVATDDVPPVRLVLAEPAPDEPRGAFKAQLCNLSGGGMGLRLTQLPKDARAVMAGRMYQCQFQLPADRAPIAVQAHLIHVRPTSDRALYLGLAFHFASEPEKRRIQEQIVRFTTVLERKRLQRRRSA